MAVMVVCPKVCTISLARTESLARTDYAPDQKSGAVVSVLKSLGPQQGVSQVKQQAQGDETGE
jgi:hypothetical protein